MPRTTVNTKDIGDWGTKRDAVKSRRTKAQDKADRLAFKTFSQLNPAEKDELLEELFVRAGLCKEG